MSACTRSLELERGGREGKFKLLRECGPVAVIPAQLPLERSLP